MMWPDIIKRIAALERQVANIQRIGTVAELDAAHARVRVQIGPLLTDWLPWLTHRAGNDRTWHAPEVGEQVIVFSQGGNLTLGVVMPAIYQAAHPAPASDENIACIEFKDGARIEYDRGSHHLKATIPGAVTLDASGDVSANIEGKLTAAITGPVSIDTKSNAAINATGEISAQSAVSVTITAPVILLNGITTINGPLTQGTGSAGGGATMQGPLEVTNDVTGGGISLKSHKHGGVDSGPDFTGAPV